MISYLDASAALATFCFLMWVTFVFAFAEKVNALVVSARSQLAVQEPGNASEFRALGRPKSWLAWASDGFVAAGATFIGEIVYDTATSAGGLPNSGEGILFFGGVAFLFWAMVNSYRVVQLVINPSRLPSVSAPRVALNLTNMVLLSGLEAFQFATLGLIVPRFSDAGLGLQIYVGAVPLGVIGFAFSLKYMYKGSEISVRNSWALVLLVLPWVILALTVFHPF